MAAKEDLPVFDEEAPCPKCGFTEDMEWPMVEWCDGTENCSHSDSGKSSGDHLHQTCAACSYEYLVKPKDTK